MKALVYYGPCDMKVVDYENPGPKAGEVLLKVKAVGICGSDVHGYLGLTGRRIPPMIMGHEVTAEVVSTTKADSRYQPGDLVFVDPITVCGACENCQEGNTSICLNKQNIGVLSDNGAFCGYIVIREENLIPVPAGIEPKIGVLAEPFSVALHGVNQLPMKIKTIRNAAVIGAGVIGICTAAVLKERYPGIKVVVADVSQKRLDRCSQVLDGGVDTIDLSKNGYDEVRNQYTKSGFDLVMEAVGVEPTVNGALALAKSKGYIVLIGNNQGSIQLAYQQIVTRELQIYGTYGFTHEDLEESMKAFGHRPYAANMIDEVVPLEQAREYFDKLAGKDHDFLKVVVDPWLGLE